MPFSFSRNSMLAKQTLENALFGNALNIQTEPHPLNNFGTAEGILIGGNLSILYSLLGTRFRIFNGA
jgi:muramoyltetrapeptide carboxypeptidase